MITIGALVSDLYDSYQKTVIRGIEYYCNKNSIRLLTFVAGELKNEFDTNNFKKTIFSLIDEKSVDVIILISSSLSSFIGTSGLDKLIHALPPIPTISLGADIHGIPSIYTDNNLGIKNVMEHLIIAHKIRKIAFLKGPDTNKEAYDRFEEYKKVLEYYGIKYNYKLVSPGTFTPGDGVKAVNLILDTRRETFEAIVCADDYGAIEVIKALNQRGIKVPQDVVVTGFDDLDMSKNFSPSLTTVRQPIFSMGYTAGDFAIRYLNTNNRIEDILINTQLIIRESCGCKIGARENDGKYFRSKDEILHEFNSIKDKYLSLFPLENIDGKIDNIILGLSTGWFNKKIDLLSDVLEEILKVSFNQNLRASFWENLILELFSVLENLKLTNEEYYFLQYFKSNSLLCLYEIEMKLTDYTSIDDRTILEYVNRNGNDLLFSRTQKELKKILKENLSILRINSLFIVIFKPNGKGELFFYRNSDNLIEDKQIVFDLNELIPIEIGSKRNSSYAIYPLVVESEYKGYVLIESKGTPAIVMDFLVEKINYGLKNIEVINQINSYTESLEKAVNERTKELRIANERLREKSMKDQLTGLNNRRFLEDVIIPKSVKITETFKNQIIYGNRETPVGENIYMGLIMVDLDFFKQVNDVYGHGSGDIVIKELAKIFSYTIRNEDYIIRMGGEEFLIVLKNFNKKFLGKMVNKLRKSVEGYSFTMENGDVINKTCSLGALSFPLSLEYPDLINFNQAVELIDKCLYIAKNSGRNMGVIGDIDVKSIARKPNPGQYIISNFSECIEDKTILTFKCD